MYCSKYVYCLLVKRIERDERVKGEGDVGVRAREIMKGKIMVWEKRELGAREMQRRDR